jgi:hypothetical protein
LIAVVLIILWLIAYIGFSDLMGNVIHVLLVLAGIAIVVRVIMERRMV